VLWRALQQYLQQTKSTGCSLTDYWQLYHEIRAKARELPSLNFEDSL
jgi:hypothetical protein